MSHRQQLDEIRRMVRAMLKEVLPEAVRAGKLPAGGAGLEDKIRKAAKGGGEAVGVAMAASADLQGFARALAEACRDGAVRDRIAGGKVNFQLAGAPSAARLGSRPGGSIELEKGVVNEVKIASLAKDYDKVIIGGGVVLTPLARDKARQAGLEIVRKAK